jgi:hypothetical protein
VPDWKQARVTHVPVLEAHLPSSAVQRCSALTWKTPNSSSPKMPAVAAFARSAERLIIGRAPKVEGQC